MPQVARKDICSDDAANGARHIHPALMQAVIDKKQDRLVLGDELSLIYVPVQMISKMYHRQLIVTFG